MDFRLSAEQQLLRDSARRLIADAGGPAIATAAQAPARDQWREFAELGWLGMPVPEAAGGLAADDADIALLCEELGRGLSSTPFIGAAVLPARLLQQCRPQRAVDAWLGEIATGSQRWALAVYEPAMRYQLQPQLSARAARDSTYQLHGDKRLVLGGAQANRLIVSACVQSDAGPTPALLVVAADALGVQRHRYALVDGVEVADFRFDGVSVDAAACLLTGEPVLATLDAAIDEARLLQCAEALGCIDRAIELTVSYLKLRQQFGKPLAEFQALQHAVAEMAIDAGSARSNFYRALAALRGEAPLRIKAVAGAVIKVMSAARSVTAAAMHLHGGIGFSGEYPVGHYLRRIVMLERLLGDREQQLARYLAPD